MQDEQKQSDTFLEKRRQLLKMGAAGMPMVLTLRASAQEAIISQLRCVITLPGSLNILVDESGAAWVGDRSIGKNKKGAFKKGSLKKFKEGADFTFPDGSVPSSYRPAACETCSDVGDDDSGGDDGGSGDDSGGDDFDLIASVSDQEGNYALNDYLAGDGDDDSDGDDSGSDDDCDSDDGGSGGEDCGYALYHYSRGQSITPGNHLSGGSSWNISGDEGLFLSLSLLYADEYGNSGSWPGVSCIVSVLNYIGQ